MLMDTDKLVGGRVEVASQSPLKRHQLAGRKRKWLTHGIGGLLGVALLRPDLWVRRGPIE